MPYISAVYGTAGIVPFHCRAMLRSGAALLILPKTTDSHTASELHSFILATDIAATITSRIPLMIEVPSEK